MARRQASKRARKNSKESVRLALVRGLTRSLVVHGSVETSETRAKMLVPFVDVLVAKAKNASENVRRAIFAKLGQDQKTTQGLFAHVVKVNGRISGFTRVIKLALRRGDAVQMVRVEWVDKEKVSPASTNKRGEEVSRVSKE